VDIIFKSRHTDVPERFRNHATAKLSKIEKLDHRAVRVDVDVSAEPRRRQAGLPGKPMPAAGEAVHVRRLFVVRSRCGLEVSPAPPGGT